MADYVEMMLLFCFSLHKNIENNVVFGKEIKGEDLVADFPGNGRENRVPWQKQGIEKFLKIFSKNL